MEFFFKKRAMILSTKNFSLKQQFHYNQRQHVFKLSLILLFVTFASYSLLGMCDYKA